MKCNHPLLYGLVHHVLLVYTKQQIATQQQCQIYVALLYVVKRKGSCICASFDSTLTFTFDADPDSYDYDCSPPRPLPPSFEWLFYLSLHRPPPTEDHRM